MNGRFHGDMKKLRLRPFAAQATLTFRFYLILKLHITNQPRFLEILLGLPAISSTGKSVHRCFFGIALRVQYCMTSKSIFTKLLVFLLVCLFAHQKFWVFGTSLLRETKLRTMSYTNQGVRMYRQPGHKKEPTP